MSRQTIVAGNWKMNGNSSDNNELLSGIHAGLEADLQTKVLVFPPFVYLNEVGNELKNSGNKLAMGAQNLSEQNNGAYTGEVSAAMLTDLGCSYVLVGHSERRSLYQESSELVASKFRVAIEAGLTPVLCIGESLEEREAGNTMDVVLGQVDAVVSEVGAEGLKKGIIAYEPVWAIGTGKTASPQQAQDVHEKIRGHLAELNAELSAGIQILYGGSVNATNATELFAMEDIDGGLIGGASLKADDFLAICVAVG